MVKSYDAKTILYNLSWDLKNMLDTNRDSQEVMTLLRSKIIFLSRQHRYENIRWWDGRIIKAKYITKEKDKENNLEEDWIIK